MKKFKIALFFLLVIAFTILIWGNWEFFSTKNSLQINLIKFVYPLPAIYNGLYLLGCFLVGFLIAMFMGLMKRFQVDRNNKLLKEKVTNQLDRIASLKKEVEFLQRNNSQTSRQPQQSNADTIENTVTQS